MRSRKILASLLLGLSLSAVNCFAGGLTITNPYKNIVVFVERDSHACEGTMAKGGGYDNLKCGGASITTSFVGNEHKPDFFHHAFYKIEVSLKFDDPGTFVSHFIDNQKFAASPGDTFGEEFNMKNLMKNAFEKPSKNNAVVKAFQAGTLGRKLYAKDFLVDGKLARVQYSLNVSVHVKEGKKVIESLEVEILDVSIPGFELKAGL